MSGSTTGAGPTLPRRPKHRVQYGHWWWALPAIVLTAVVIYISTVSGAFFAFTDWTGIGSFNFIGFQNFVRIFQSPELIGALRNTLVLAAGFLVLTNVFGILFALALNRTLKTRYLLRTLIFMPVVLSPVAVSYMWKFIFEINGPLNQTLGAVGLKGLETDWLGNPNTALWCVLVVMVWQTTGLVMVTYLAGLATVPDELEEAAALDGASRWRRFRSVTVPVIQPSIVIATMLMLVQGLRVFDQVLALTGGGPYGATQTLATEVYQQTFINSQFGFGAALAVVMTILIVVFAALQQSATRDRQGMDA